MATDLDGGPELLRGFSVSSTNPIEAVFKFKPIATQTLQRVLMSHTLPQRIYSQYLKEVDNGSARSIVSYEIKGDKVDFKIMTTIGDYDGYLFLDRDYEAVLDQVTESIANSTGWVTSVRLLCSSSGKEVVKGETDFSRGKYFVNVTVVNSFQIDELQTENDRRKKTPDVIR